MNKKRVFIGGLLLLLSICFVSIYVCNRIITSTASGKLFSATQTIPFNKVGLLLGTSKYLANGRNNPYYDYRIEAATQLVKAGKIKYVIVSGDNSRIAYNEPASMRSDLMNAGIDSTIIYLDYAGFRTFDSMVRLKEIFGVDTVTIISQQFHNERAIYTAARLGITAIGYNAKDVGSRQGFTTQAREKLARVKTFLDFLFNKKPKFLETV